MAGPCPVFPPRRFYADATGPEAQNFLDDLEMEDRSMDTPILVAFISAAAVIVPAISFYLTKKKEREAEWQRAKFELYKELVVHERHRWDGFYI